MKSFVLASAMMFVPAEANVHLLGNLNVAQPVEVVASPSNCVGCATVTGPVRTVLATQPVRSCVREVVSRQPVRSCVRRGVRVRPLQRLFGGFRRCR